MDDDLKYYEEMKQGYIEENKRLQGCIKDMMDTGNKTYGIDRTSNTLQALKRLQSTNTQMIIDIDKNIKYLKEKSRTFMTTSFDTTYGRKEPETQEDNSDSIDESIKSNISQVLESALRKY